MEGLTLAIDASTYQGSAALFRDGAIVAERTVAMRGEHEERLMPAVADALASAGVATSALARVVCGAGPGSFTSLRIGAAIAKGIARASGIPLFAVSSLALVAIEAGAGRWLVTLDALRGESYAAAFEWNGEVLAEIAEPAIVAEADIAAFASSVGATLVAGRPHARAAGLALPALLHAGAVDLGAWEPSYGRRAEAQVRWEAAHGRPLAP